MENFINEYKKNLSKIRKEYPQLQVWSDSHIILIHNSIYENHQMIYEFITKSVNIFKTVGEFRKKFKGHFAEITPYELDPYDIPYYDNRITILLNKLRGDITYIDEMDKFLDTFGWFRSEKDTEQKNSPLLILDYEAKYDTEIDPVSTKYYYHLVPDIFWPNIETTGLTPKTKSKLANHPERIYLIDKYDEEEFKRLAEVLYENIGYKSDIKNKIKNYYVLRIDVEKLIKSGRDKFYKDPNYLLGIWTYENIPPAYIKKIDEILINKQ